MLHVFGLWSYIQSVVERARQKVPACFAARRFRISVFKLETILRDTFSISCLFIVPNERLDGQLIINIDHIRMHVALRAYVMMHVSHPT